MTTCLALVLLTGVLVHANTPKEEAVKQEWKKLEGTWVVLRLDIDGKSLLEKDKPAPRLTIKDGKILPGPQSGVGAQEESPQIELDPTHKPKTLNVPNFKGGDPKAGVTLIAIYELNGDELKVCAEGVETARLQEREKDRPKAFDSNQGALVILKRERR